MVVKGCEFTPYTVDIRIDRSLQNFRADAVTERILRNETSGGVATVNTARDRNT